MANNKFYSRLWKNVMARTAFVVSIGVSLVLGFQNCGQQQSIHLSSNQDVNGKNIDSENDGVFYKGSVEVSPNQAPPVQFVEKCLDVQNGSERSWSQAGFVSREDCLTDGNWHLIFENSASGSALYGSIADLHARISKGVETRVVVPDYNGAESCQSIYEANGSPMVIHCLISTRFSGEGMGYHGSARYSTNGAVFCNDMIAPGGNNCAGVSARMKWLVRY